LFNRRLTLIHVDTTLVPRNLIWICNVFVQQR